MYSDLNTRPNSSLSPFQEFRHARNSVTCQTSHHTQDYCDYAKAKFAPNASSIGKCVVVGGYGLMLRGKAGIVTDVKSEEGRPIAVVILDDKPEIPRAFRPQDLTIEGYVWIYIHPLDMVLILLV